MQKLAFPLRAVLFLVKLGKPGNKPLPKLRLRTFLFMRLMNRIAGIKTRNFHSITTRSFIAIEGHEIKLKVFTPVKTAEPLPVWMYFHGGGFALGSYIARSNFTKAIAARAGCVVVAVKYRLAPEHPFPAAVNDCYEACRWVAEHAVELGIDKNRMAVGGESAGGNLSATVSLMARDKGTPQIIHQTLLYPAVDMAMNYPSIEKYGEGYMLTQALIKQFHEAYLPDEASLGNPYCSPILANLEGLPPAVVITAEYDPLVEQGDLYADKLKQAGVPVAHKNYKGMIHDFALLMPTWLPEARESFDMIVRELKKAFEKN
jgi:acetyl esterase